MTATGNAIAKAENSPAAVIGQYTADFQLVLPANFRPETFVRLAQGALRRDVKLKQAAENNPGSLLFALLDAARLGHEPGTDEYHLTVRKRKGSPEVLGIEGYKGITKRMMQHPKVLSVVAEVVYSGDVFEWVPGQMERPSHRVDWFGDRGEVKGAYAYAVLVGNATSKVVVVGPQEIQRAMKAAESPDGSYSPWRNDYAAMVRKTALRRLEPYVPKAAEITAEQADRTAAASEVTQRNDLPELPPAGTDDTSEAVEVVDGEVVGDELPDNPDFGDQP